MKTQYKGFRFNTLSVAVLTGLMSFSTIAQDTAENDAIEEVVVKASRLKGTASAVIEERKNQAFVADILGAEQISRTGDSDAAAALRRVTGLTLVDGKFIYVRGLGERYSSTQLNGATVPSPDPTRTVIPLDLFPSAIIESLSVQKSYSPSMPAHFGGGNVDIRLKTMPNDFFVNIAANAGGNNNNFDDGYFYSGGDNDWRGRDDGRRSAPEALQHLWRNYQPLSEVSQADNRVIAEQLYRDYNASKQGIDPDYGVDFSIGDYFTPDADTKFGYLAAVSYDNQWQVSERYEGQDFRQNTDGSWSLIRGFDHVSTTEHAVKLSGMLNLGLVLFKDHRFDYSLVMLRDTLDRMDEKLGNTNNVLLSDGLRVRDSDVTYEERQMTAHQFSGTHNFPKLWNLGVDWKYSDAKSRRYAPGNVSTRFILADANEDGVFDRVNESSLRKATTASRYNFQELDDQVENYGVNFSLPLFLDGTEIELKAGSDFVRKNRDAFARRLDVNTLAFDNLDLTGTHLADILTSDVILNHPLNGSNTIIRDTSVKGDDYYSAQMIDAYYVEADVFFDNTWRLSGGVRWEDYRQVVAPIDPATGQFVLPTSPTDEDLAELAFQEDDFYPAIALTYIIDEHQFRLSYGQTTVRPDIREVAPTTYLDPLTTYPVRGTAGIQTTDVKNYDFRWEWYLSTGESLSVGLFYKDMLNPIESVQSPAQDGPPLVVIANADDGEIYGVEVEFMKDFAFVGGIGNDFFLSGNVTLSDSEININTQRVVDQTGVSAAITNNVRRLTGHSQYVVNLNLGYDAPNGNHSATLAYNVFGERIILPGIEGQDDKYEQPFHSLDLVYTYYPSFASTLKFKIQNLLDENKEIEFSNTLFRQESKGIGFDISYKYEF